MTRDSSPALVTVPFAEYQALKDRCEAAERERDDYHQALRETQRNLQPLKTAAADIVLQARVAALEAGLRQALALYSQDDWYNEPAWDKLQALLAAAAPEEGK